MLPYGSFPCSFSPLKAHPGREDQNMKKLLTGLLVLALTLTAFAGCTDSQSEIASLSPSVSETLPETPKIKTFTVSTVDEFLAALNSNTVIELTDTAFRLDQASDYGQDSDNPAYYWEETLDGYELVLNHLHDLTIKGAGLEETALLTAPRYSSILFLDSCKRITLQDLTCGHTDGAEPCTGGVIRLYECREIALKQAGLFGCGVVGLDASQSQQVALEKCRIYDCSQNGILAQSVTGLDILGTDFYTIGEPAFPASSVIALYGCKDTNVENCSLSENSTSLLIEAVYCENTVFQNMEARANTVRTSAFRFLECQPAMIDCNLEGNTVRHWYTQDSSLAKDARGSLIGNDQLPDIVEIREEDLPRQEQFTVSTVDEFLAAIGPDREIILKPEFFDLSTAFDYGTGRTSFYQWEEIYDGPGLVITNVSNMTIRAESDMFGDQVISAVPRYANVLGFRGCDHIRLEGFTAGHEEMPGECCGGVLFFSGCDHVTVHNCGLFGCGVLGVDAEFCTFLEITGNDIYDCSFGGVSLRYVDSVTIEGNKFRNLGGPDVMTQEVNELTCDVPLNDYGEPLN